MKKEQAIGNFIRRNYKLLIQRGSFDKKRYNDAKRAYFGNQLRFKFSIPRDREICNCFVDFLVKVQRIPDRQSLEEIIAETPFLKMNNVRGDDYVGLIDLVMKKYAIKEETKGLAEVEKQEKLLSYIKRESAKEIEELIKKKEEEYRRLPSILDDSDFEEPEELPKQEEAKEWWEELKLKENPFPGPLDGFFLIDTSLYDEIVVETPPIQWALGKITKEPIDIFHRGFLLGGEFGTGKTTFFDFLAPRLTMQHIEPLRIALSENISAAHYAQKFEKEICMEVAKRARKYDLPRSPRIIDFEEACLLMLEIQDKGAKGFLIFLDDLHKTIDTNRVFNFLANLQVTKNNFSRNGIRVVFVVAGFPSWRDRIRRDSALTGFFDAADELTLPEVTPKLAAQAIRKRLQVFSINPEKELAVKETFLKAIFKRVSSEIGRANIGFRPYIQEAIKNFQQKRFDILSIDFTKLDENVMQAIQLTLEANSDFKKGIDRLVFGGRIKRKEVREMTLKVLCEIYLRNGVTEDEEIFEKNMFSFQRLEQCGLIQKFDRKGELVWKVSPFLCELNKEVIAKSHLSMEDYLVPIYSTPVQRAKRKRVELNKIQVFERKLKRWSRKLEPSVLQSLQIALTMYSENIFPFAEANSERSEPRDRMPRIDKIKECIWAMMKGIIRFESPTLLDICGESDIRGWTLRHRTLEYSQAFISMVQNLGDDGVEEADITRLISFANDAFSELWTEFDQSMNIYQSCYVKPYEIPKKTLKTIFSEQETILSVAQPRKEYFDSLSNLVREVEQTMRQYLLVSCTLVFGPYHLRIRHYPEDIKKYVGKNPPSPSVSHENYNEFENLNRGQYRFLFTQIRKPSGFYRYIITPLINKWDSRDVNAFFQLFGELDIIAGHTKTISVEDRKKDVPTFFRLSCRLISAMSTRLRSLVIFSSTVLHGRGKTFVVFGYNYERNRKVRRMVDMEEATDVPDGMYYHEITRALRTGGIDSLMEHSDNIFGGVEVDLLDVEGTAIKFNMRYPEVIALITTFVASDKLRIIPLYGTTVALAKI
ncbi:MAG: hypothetical protein E3J73_07200 [Candidatus Bathyarchaeum sp.]|nr:MAG: hypothetical protein E3J73_07200 [Candidatus Bathyarchaeum sp.]